MEAKYDEWVRKYPLAYVARLARGICFEHVGDKAQGNDPVPDATAEQMHGMEEAYRRAARDFEYSMTLDAKPILSYRGAISVNWQFEEKRRFLDLAIKADPETFIVRESYMANLQTRFGGSVAQMEPFLEECKKSPLSVAQLRELRALVAEE